MPRHHLIEEAKAELDVAYEEVKRAEREIMALESEYNERIKTSDAKEACVETLMAEKERRQDDCRIEEIYKLQKNAIERFARISSAFTIIGSVHSDGVGVDLLRGLLFSKQNLRTGKVEIDRAVKAFVRNLRAFSLDEDGYELDKDVRESWAVIEEILNEGHQAHDDN